jgi:hypothetical protein
MSAGQVSGASNSHLVRVVRPELMAGWLAALSGITTLLLLACSTFLITLLLLTTILLRMPTLLLLSPFQFLFFLPVHLCISHERFAWRNAFQGREVPAPLKGE